MNSVIDNQNELVPIEFLTKMYLAEYNFISRVVTNQDLKEDVKRQMVHNANRRMIGIVGKIRPAQCDCRGVLMAIKCKDKCSAYYPLRDYEGWVKYFNWSTQISNYDNKPF